MSEAGVSTPADLEQTVRAMERFGFARRPDSDTFAFRTPAYRYLDLCLQMAAVTAAGSEPPRAAEATS